MRPRTRACWTAEGWIPMAVATPRTESPASKQSPSASTTARVVIAGVGIAPSLNGPLSDPGHTIRASIIAGNLKGRPRRTPQSPARIARLSILYPLLPTLRLAKSPAAPWALFCLRSGRCRPRSGWLSSSMSRTHTGEPGPVAPPVGQSGLPGRGRFRQVLVLE